MQTGTSEKSAEEPLSAGSIVATLLPLFLLVVMWIFIVRFMIRVGRRSAESLKQNEQMITLLKEIRDLLSKGTS